MPVTKVKNDEQFDQAIENSQKRYIVAQFITNWSSQCREFADKYEEMSGRYPNVSFITVNIDDNNHDLAENLNINSTPTFLFFESGKLAPLHIVVTNPSQKHLSQALNKIMNGGGRAPHPDERRPKKRPHGPPGPPRGDRRPRGPPSPRGRRGPPDRGYHDRYHDGYDEEYRYHKPSKTRPPRDYDDDY